MKDNYLTDIDEFLRSDHGTAFDRAYFARRKMGERRIECSKTIMPGQILRSEIDRRTQPDRRRRRKRNHGETLDVTSWET